MKFYLIFVGYILITFYCCSTLNQTKTHSEKEIKEFLLGKWSKCTEDNLFMEVKNDEIRYFKNNKVYKTNPIQIIINDSVKFFRTQYRGYNFLQSDGEIKPMIQIIEYDTFFKDTIKSIIVYIDDESMTIASGVKPYYFCKIEK